MYIVYCIVTVYTTLIPQMQRLVKVYTTEKERESAELEECKRLSFENSVLCQRIKTLEEETCHLADKLIKVIRWGGKL